MQVGGSVIDLHTSGKKWNELFSAIKTHETMRIKKISYVVKASGSVYVVSVARIVGLKVRQPVLVRAKK